MTSLMVSLVMQINNGRNDGSVLLFTYYGVHQKVIWGSMLLLLVAFGMSFIVLGKNNSF